MPEKSPSSGFPVTGWPLWETAVPPDHDPLPSLGAAPSLPPPPPVPSISDPLSLAPGHQIDDYQVTAILGRGAFGVVYLAWQVSLGRQIALKVSPSVGHEGRTLARLDHPHIVRVHSETVRDGLRLLCMQYVPSLDLEHILDHLNDRPATWTGADLLSVIDERLAIAAEFDPEQIADRQHLNGLDHVAAVCWIVARLADAVGHAHRQGVLHRDLKPGNVLVSQYGRPMLVDFNLADFTHTAPHGSQLFGGTLPFMSPEHLDAFNPEHPATPADVTEQSDIYSLGVILFRLLTGALPFATAVDGTTQTERIRKMSAARRDPGPVWSHPHLATEPALLTVVQRCLAPSPADRWRSADELSRALGSVIDLRQTLHRVATNSPWPKWWSRRPFSAMILVGLTPHLLGSLVNIPYNLLRIVGFESPRLDVFLWLCNVYNIALYPGCIALCVSVVRPVLQDWKRRERGEIVPPAETAAVRRQVLTFPWWAMRVALLGWLPGAIWFPLGLHLWAGPLSRGHVAHLQLSVALSGLIALTYSALGVLCLTTAIFYPKVSTDPVAFRTQAAEDVRPLLFLTKLIPFLAIAIPLAGAMLLVGTSPREFKGDFEYLAFRWLTMALIALGMTGLQVALWATGVARTAIEAFGGRERIGNSE